MHDLLLVLFGMLITNVIGNVQGYLMLARMKKVNDRYLEITSRSYVELCKECSELRGELESLRKRFFSKNGHFQADVRATPGP